MRAIDSTKRSMFGGAVVCTSYADGSKDAWEATFAGKVYALLLLVLAICLMSSASRGMAKRYNRVYNSQTAVSVPMSKKAFALWSLENLFNAVSANLYGLYLDIAN